MVFHANTQCTNLWESIQISCTKSFKTAWISGNFQAFWFHVMTLCYYDLRICGPANKSLCYNYVSKLYRSADHRVQRFVYLSVTETVNCLIHWRVVVMQRDSEHNTLSVWYVSRRSCRVRRRDGECTRRLGAARRRHDDRRLQRHRGDVVPGMQGGTLGRQHHWLRIQRRSHGHR